MAVLWLRLHGCYVSEALIAYTADIISKHVSWWNSITQWVSIREGGMNDSRSISENLSGTEVNKYVWKPLWTRISNKLFLKMKNAAWLELGKY